MAAMPSPEPVNPMPSVVVAVSDTSQPMAWLNACCASSRRLPIFGRLATTTTLALTGLMPCARKYATVARSIFVAVFAGTGGIGTDSEKHAYITQSGCGKQRVNQRMGCDITVRITFDAVTVPTQTGKP
mgnify:CR=1 FL=1